MKAVPRVAVKCVGCGGTMADNRKPYRVDIGGREHTMLLTDQDAREMYGDRATPVQEKAAPTPKNKARSAQNKK